MPPCRRTREGILARAMGAVERDVSSPEVIEGVDGGWDVSSQKVLGCEGGHGDGTSPPREGGFDRGWHDRKQRESMAARRVVSGPSDFARPVRRLAHPRNPRNPRSLLCWSRVGRSCWAPRAAAQPSGFAAGSTGPQSTQKDAEPGGAGLGLGPHRLRSAGGGSLDGLSFVAVVSRRLTGCGVSGVPPPPTPSAGGGGWTFWGRGTGGGGLTALPPATV